MEMKVDPQPAILKGPFDVSDLSKEEVEELDAIQNWMLNETSDPIVYGARRIQKAECAYHELIAEQLNLRLLLTRKVIPLLDKLSTEIWNTDNATNRYRIGVIKKFIQAGAKG